MEKRKLNRIYTKSYNVTIQKAYDDEPLFVIRAQDATALSIIDTWIELNNVVISPERKESAQHVRDAIERWQQKYPNRVKMPD